MKPVILLALAFALMPLALLNMIGLGLVFAICAGFCFGVVAVVL